MTTVINLYGGPGTGKSTSAAYLYFLLKSNQKDVELVREYVKEWAWEGREIGVYDQLYFVGKQVRKESLVYNKVDYIVTDSPVLLGYYYSKEYSPPAISLGVQSAIMSYYKQAEADGHKHIHIFLNRTKPYVSSGRYQTADEAKNMDSDMKQLFINLGISFVECGTEENDLKAFAAKYLGIKD